MDFIMGCGIAAVLAVSASFDVPAVAPVQSVVRQDVTSAFPGGRHVELTLPVSVAVDPSFRGELSEVHIEVRSQHTDVLAADFAPRSSSADRRQIATAAGTIDRRSGVFFRFSSPAAKVLEGQHVVRVTLEVPHAWRGDLLRVNAVAYGKGSDAFASSSKEPLGRGDFQIAVYQYGDAAAAETAIHFARNQQRLLAAAEGYSAEIARRSNPTPVHKLGAVLDLYRPAIPADWLQQWLYGSAYQKPIVELPVDLKVVMLDFQESRTAQLNLAHQPAAALSANSSGARGVLAANQAGVTHTAGYPPAY